MATESPLIHDGGQTTAAANFWNPSSALAGPQGSGQFLGCYVSSSRTVTLNTTVGTQIYGVLQNTPNSGQACDVGIMGLTKMVAGASVAAFTELMVDSSGRFIAWVSGSSYFKVGISIESPSAANQVFLGMVYNPNIRILT